MPKTLNRPKAKSPIRRHVRIESRVGGQVMCTVKSMTKDDGTQYNPTIDVETMEFSCDCPDHEYRHRFCKHVRKSALNLIRRGELNPVILVRNGDKSCHKCGSDKSLFPMSHPDGSLMDDVLVCYPCIEVIRAEARGATKDLPSEPVIVDESEPLLESQQWIRDAEAAEAVNEGTRAAYCRRAASHFAWLEEKAAKGEDDVESSTVASDEEGEREETPAFEFCVCGRQYPFQFGKAFCVSCRATTDAMHAAALSENSKEEDVPSTHPDGEDNGGHYFLTRRPFSYYQQGLAL